MIVRFHVSFRGCTGYWFFPRGQYSRSSIIRPFEPLPICAKGKTLIRHDCIPGRVTFPGLQNFVFHKNPLRKSPSKWDETWYGSKKNGDPPSHFLFFGGSAFSKNENFLRTDYNASSQGGGIGMCWASSAQPPATHPPAQDLRLDPKGKTKRWQPQVRVLTGVLFGGGIIDKSMT